MVDSRLTEDGSAVRRRRECAQCGRRFTTYERLEAPPIFVIKKDGRREPFDRMKIFIGLKKASEKRPVSITVLEKLVDKIEHAVQEKGEKEIPSKVIGEAVMMELFNLDHVAYVRFASVYRSFKDISEFMNELTDLLGKQKAEAKGRG